MTAALYRLPASRQWRYWLPLGHMLLVMVGILTGLSLATQYSASALGYDPALGAPLVGRFYNPLDYLFWQWRLDSSLPIVAETWRVATLLFAGTALSVLLGAVGFYHLLLRSFRATDLHGSAHWANAKEIANSGLLEKSNGVMLGSWNGQFLRHSGPEHILAFAPTRSGKGVGIVIPTLLTWPHSAVIYDIKGENWACTSGWRREYGPVFRFDPTCAGKTGTRFNPLWEIRPGIHEVRDAQNIADILVDPDGQGEMDHWKKSAHTLLTGLLLHVLHTQAEKTLYRAATLLSDPEMETDDMLDTMLFSPSRAVGSIARELLNKSTEERSGIVSTALSCLSLYRDPVIAQNTAVSDFRIADLVGEKPVSLYLAVPPSDLSRTRPLLRLMLNQIGRRLTERLRTIQHPLLLMLDEFPTLGKLQFFHDALAYMAGYGLKACLIAQDISQLHAAYGKDESIISNCHLRVAFAPNRIETAEILSKMAGTATVISHSHSISEKRGGVSESSQETGRPLLTPDEAMRLPVTDALIFAAGYAPIHARKLRYYETPELQRRAVITPPASDRLPIHPPAFPVIATEPESSKEEEFQL